MTLNFSQVGLNEKPRNLLNTCSAWEIYPHKYFEPILKV